MQNTQISALPILVKAALADAQFKVMQGIWQKGSNYWCVDKSLLDSTLYPSKWGTTDDLGVDRNHPYWRACDEARELCVELGRFCLAHGLDPSSSPLVENLSFKSCFFEAFEKGRIVTCDELTPSVIHDAVEKRNVLQWAGWTVTAGPSDFATGDYGEDEYIRPLIAKHESGECEISLWMPGHPKDRAREAYELITGSAFTGEDTLGKDAKHWFEPDDDHYDDDYADDDLPEFEEPYELSGEEMLDLMVISAKLDIEEMAGIALRRIADGLTL
jgi:hypothetical protein